MDRGLYIAACVYKVDKAGRQLYRAKEAPYVEVRETQTTFQTHVSSFLFSVYCSWLTHPGRVYGHTWS